MERASCKHLTYKYKPFFGCTFEESALVVGAMLTLSLVVSLVIGLIIGGFMPIFIGLFILTVAITKPVLKKLGRYKEGKQQGYLMLKAKLKFYQWTGLNLGAPFLMGQGIWSKRRSNQ